MSSNLPYRLKKHMELSNITARELERKAGLKISAVTNIVTGRSKNPSVETLVNIAKVLNCDVDDLVSPDEKTTFIAKEWNLSLLISAAEVVDQCIKEKGKPVAFPMILRMIREVYTYSSGRGESKADLMFARWVADRAIS